MGRLAVVLVAAAVCAGCGAARAGVRLQVAPARGLLDSPVVIRVHGAPRGARVELAVSEDGWVGRGVYRVRHDGTVDVRRDPSLGGSYTGRHAMGLFWSMRPGPRAAAATPVDGGVATIELLRGSKRLASASLVRERSARGVTERALTPSRDGVFGRYFAPQPDGRRRPAVVVFGGSEGGLSTAPDAALLASHGFPALALAYFGEPGLPRELGRIPLEYFARAVAWLGRRPAVDPRRLVVYGESRGSEAALELGVHYPALVHGVVAIVPSSEVNPGNVTYGAGVVPAWTFRGQAIPFTGSAANIPVERIRGPILVAGGGRDLVWPSYYHAQDIAERSRQRHGPRVVVDDYPDAGHFGYAVPNLPSGDAFYVAGQRRPIGGTTAANAAARADLWPRILRFLGRVPVAGR